MNPLVSIIIPTFNRAHLIGETLDSVLAQTYTNWECIVVDDGSTDNTTEVMATYMEKDARFQYHHRPAERPKGANACRNYGFERCKGEFVNWFDSDDVMLKDFIKVKIEAFREGLDFVLCSVYYVDENLNITKLINLNTEGDLFKDYILLKQRVLTPSILYRKSILVGLKLYREKLSRGQEMEFLSRLFFKLPKEKYKIINEPLFLYRQHTHTISGTDVKYIYAYKESFAFIYVENLRRALLLKDVEMTRYNYILLVYLLSEAVDKRHFVNFKYILNSLFKSFIKRNFLLSLKMTFIYSLLFLLGRKSYSIERYFINTKIKLY